MTKNTSVCVPPSVMAHWNISLKRWHLEHFLKLSFLIVFFLTVHVSLVSILKFLIRIFKTKSYSMEFKSKSESVIPNEFPTKHIIPFVWKLLKLMNHGIDVSRSTEKLFFYKFWRLPNSSLPLQLHWPFGQIDRYFGRYFVRFFCPGAKSMGVTHIAYIVIHKL